MTPASLLAEIVGVSDREARKYLTGERLIPKERVRTLSTWHAHRFGHKANHEFHAAYHAALQDDFTARLGAARPRALLWNRVEIAYERGELPAEFDLAFDQYGDDEVMLIRFVRCRAGRKPAGEEFCIFERRGEVYLGSQLTYNPRKGNAREIVVQMPPGGDVVRLGEIDKILYVEASANG